MANFDAIPSQYISAAKSSLHIAYQHTSHGSQLITGLESLRRFPAYFSTYDWDDAGARAGALDLDDNGISAVADLSQGDWIDGNGVTPWVTATRNLLNNPNNAHINVVMWSWCSINGHNIARYLENMEILIREYPHVKFIFMTGHAEGQGEGGSVWISNQQIRQHCIQNGRILFDFADIESFDPGGRYYFDKNMRDNLDYYENGAWTNWARQWLTGNPSSTLAFLTRGTGGFAGTGSCAHSNSPADANLNCVLKGRGAWALFARLAGWDGR